MSNTQWGFSMIPIITSKKGRINHVEKSWNYLFTNLSGLIKKGDRSVRKYKLTMYRALNKKVKGKSASEHLKPLFKVILEASEYSSLPYIPSGRRVDILYSLKQAGKRKRDTIKSIGGEGYYLPSIMYAIANNYIIAVDEGNRIFIARSPLGDFFVKEFGHILKEKDRLTPELILTYILLPALTPSYTSILYLMMNDLRMYDVEAIAKSIETKALTTTTRYKRMYFSMMNEIDNTWFCGKYKGISVKYKFVTPSCFGYQLARAIDSLIEFNTYRKLLLFVSHGKGLPSEGLFKHLFKDITISEDMVKGLVQDHPLLASVSSTIDKLRVHYERIESEISRLAS